MSDECIKMYKTILVIICAVASAENISAAQTCDEHDTIITMKKPIYDFSVRFLHKISYGISNHFVYSPLSTWLQLVMLADGAQRRTLNEIWDVTGLRGYRKKTCYRRKFKEMLNEMEDNSQFPIKRRSAVIIDKFFKVDDVFKSKVESWHNVKVESLDFDDLDNSAIKANNILEDSDGEESVALILPEDFYHRVLLMADIAYFKSAWKSPFNEAQTKPAAFYSNAGIERGTVDMMNQVGLFKEADISLINARVLELPLADDRTSLFIYLPINGSISDIFNSLKDTTLTGLINKLEDTESKPLNISLPKFQIRTETVNIPELLHDMGLDRAFYPEKAELRRITSSGHINVSSMSQLSSINVTETLVEASAIAETLIAADTKPIDFNANRPFAFTLVDKKLEIILFAGIYSDPS